MGFASGYSVVLCNSDGRLEKEAAYIEVLIAKQVDGVVFIAAGGHHGHLEELAGLGIPVVLTDRDIPQARVDVVLVDNERGGYDATSHLIELGHRRIACVTGPSDVTPSAGRVSGYRRALADSGIPVDESLIVPGDFRYHGGEAAMARLLGLDNPPSGALICNDLMAIGALRAVRDAGLQVPNDISIIGFDGIAVSSAVSPALTTVAQPIEELGSLATKRLIARIRGELEGEAPQRIVLQPKLLIRDSCAPLEPRA